MEPSDIIQLISLPLELVGLYLTISEIFFPQKHSKLQTAFVQRLTRYEQHAKTAKLKITWIFSILFFLIPMIWLMIAAPENVATTIAMFFLLVFTGVYCGGITYKVLCVLLPGRNLLSFGITLTILGVIGEVPQVIGIVKDWF